MGGLQIYEMEKRCIMKTENWCGHIIRFVEIDGEWWAILKDICDALELRTAKVAERLDPNMIYKIDVDVSETLPKDVTSKARKTQNMIVVNELGIYEALFASRKPEARKFRRWTTTVLQKLRRCVGLEGYEVLRMTDEDVQEDIDHILDTLYWDEEKKMVMQSVTVQGGDVEQIPFE